MVRIEEINPPPYSTASNIRNRSTLEKRKLLRSIKDRSPKTIGYLLRNVGPPKVPKCATLGFYSYPFLIQASSVGMFCALIGFLVPYWAWTWNADTRQYAVFGLWSYCETTQKYCTSIHDNIIPGRDVPVWFVMVQWTNVIGVAMSLVVLAILMHNYNGKTVKMSPTVYTAAESVSGIAALQKFVSLYTFVTYFSHLDFLHAPNTQLDYHGAFFCSVISFCCDVIIAVVLFLEEDIGPMPVTNNILLDGAKDYEYSKMKVFKQGADTYLYNPDTSEMEYHLNQDIPKMEKFHFHAK